MRFQTFLAYSAIWSSCALCMENEIGQQNSRVVKNKLSSVTSSYVQSYTQGVSIDRPVFKVRTVITASDGLDYTDFFQSVKTSAVYDSVTIQNLSLDITDFFQAVDNIKDEKEKVSVTSEFERIWIAKQPEFRSLKERRSDLKSEVNWLLDFVQYEFKKVDPRYDRIPFCNIL
jgi:hypothetical protein